jgi:two-component system, chemotaxis family, sensor kinase CheA
MDVVRRKIADIRGEVEVESKINQGTTITIKLPLTLSIIDGLLVKIQDTFYVLPLTSVDKIYAADHQKLVNTFNNLIVLDGQQIPFFYLRGEFDIEENKVKNEQIVVVRYEDKRIGLAVDTVIGEYQAVLKPLGKYYKNQEIISGATILGDGTIALVIDTNKAIKYFSMQFSQNVMSEDKK